MEQVCTCLQEPLFEEPLLEVLEYPAMPLDPSPLNRGIRLLQTIKAGTILGEYVGEIHPKDAEENLGDDTYLFQIWGPQTTRLNHGTEEWVIELGEAIAVLTGAVNSNWTRFLNHRDGGKHNVEFTAQIVGYRVMILAVARRNLRFGEELTVSYGDEYFE
jgi:hypothetical protein